MIKENQRTLNQINGLTDVLILFPCMILAYFIRFTLFHGMPGHIGLPYYLMTVLCVSPLFWLLYGLMGLYDSFRAKNFLQEFSLLLRSNTIIFGILLAFFFAFKQFHLSRWTLFVFFALATIAVAVKRWFLRRLLRSFREHGYNLKHVLLIGCGEQAQAYCCAVQNDRTLGFCVDSYLAPRDCLPGIAYMPSRPSIDEVGDVSLVNLRHIPLDNIGNAFLKRAVDIVGSLLLILCTSPIMLFAAIGVKLSSPGPILFKQERVGLNKTPFYMYKFRSMRVNDKQNTGWSTNSDPRKTKFGSFIRKFSIDELPQFFNVLMGDMSLVGPRPELPYFVNQFKESVPLYMVKHQVRPGITGWAQVNGFRGDTSIQGRIEHDIYYIENWTLLFDIKILFMTVFKFSNDETLGK